MSKILVTGGVGKTATSLAAQLQRAGADHRTASRRGDPPFDWERPETWADVLEDVGAIYLVAPGTVHEPYSRIIEFIELASRRGVQRFVFLSMAGLPAGGPAHGQVHQYLKDNAEDWAVLCPSAFMQNFSVGPYLATIREESRIYSNTGAGRVPFIDAEDIAAVAFAVLTASAPANREFVLTGAESLSYDRVAELIGDVCGRRVTHVRVTMEDMTGRLMQRGIPEATAKLLAFGYEMVAAGAADRTTDEVATLMGRPPIDFESFATANAEVWAQAG